MSRRNGGIAVTDRKNPAPIPLPRAAGTAPQALQAADKAPYLSRGSICVLCRACVALGLPHACITEAGPIDAVATTIPAAEWPPLAEGLARRPARPLGDDGERRGVDRAWCVCQHGGTGA